MFHRKARGPVRRSIQNTSKYQFIPISRLLGIRYGLVLATVLTTICSVRPAAAQYTETESNNTKGTSNVFNLGTATSATISGTSANNSDPDYFQINTSYQTAGIYRNQLQLANVTQNIGRIRGLTQTTGTINAGTDVAFQTSSSSGTTINPQGFNQYYSFGGAGKTQSVYYSVGGAGSAVGGNYTATFSSARITPTFTTSVGQGDITFNALANVGSGGQSTSTSIVVLDSNYNVYYDNVANSPTFGFAASNDNPATGVQGFSLKRRFNPGTYYVAIGISVVGTNDAAPPDEILRSNPVLDFDNVIATNNSNYDGGNTGSTRPADFSITNSLGNTVYTSSGQSIQSLFALNFYQINVTVAPEPSSLLLTLMGGASGCGMWIVRRKRTRPQPNSS